MKPMATDTPMIEGSGTPEAAARPPLPFALEMGHFDPSIRLIAELGALHRQWQTEMDCRLREHGLSHVRWIILWRIVQSAAEPTQTEVARLVGIETSTLVRQLDTLEKHGLIERVAGADRRMKRIRLTPAAAEVIVLVREIAARLSGELLAGVADSRVADCTDLLHAMRERLADRATGPS